MEVVSIIVKMVYLHDAVEEEKKDWSLTGLPRSCLAVPGPEGMSSQDPLPLNQSLEIWRDIPPRNPDPSWILFAENPPQNRQNITPKREMFLIFPVHPPIHI